MLYSSHLNKILKILIYNLFHPNAALGIIIGKYTLNVLQKRMKRKHKSSVIVKAKKGRIEYDK